MFIDSPSWNLEGICAIGETRCAAHLVCATLNDLSGLFCETVQCFSVNPGDRAT